MQRVQQRQYVYGDQCTHVQYRIYIFNDKCTTCTTEVICVW